MSKWEMVKLGDVCEKIVSGEWGSEDVEGKGYPVLRTTNFTDEGFINYHSIVTRNIDTKKFEKKSLLYGDILIEKSGGSDTKPVGRVVYFDRENNKFLFNNFTALIRVNSGIYSKYIFYFLYYGYLSGITAKYENKTTGIHNLRLNDFMENTLIPLPPLDEQKRIANNLDHASDLIKLYKEQLTELDKLIQSVFYEMFGESKINFKNWPTKKLGQIAIVGSSKRVFTHELVDNGIPFYRGTEIGALAVGKAIKPELFITIDHYQTLCESSGEPSIGDLLMPSICHDGRIWRVDTEDPFYFKDGRVLWIHFQEQTNNAIYMQFALKEKLISDYKNIASGTTFAELKIFALKDIKVMLPHLSLQNRFAEIVTAIETQKAQVQTALEEAQTLFDSLMQQYFA